MIEPPPGSPADLAMRGEPLPEQAERRRARCRCALASCGHCRRDHRPDEGACKVCACRGFV